MITEFDDPYEFEQMLEAVDEQTVLMMLGIFGVVALVIGVIALVGYILQSIGLYTIAKNRDIRNPWLAWLPIGSEWIAGSIADQYQYVVNGRVTNRRKILLILQLVVIGIALAVNQIPMFFMVDGDMANFGAAGGMLAMLNMVTTGLNIAVFVMWQISLYDLYTSCNPKNNTLYLVLGIIFGVAVPYFIFFNRKKELGMPPRKTNPQPEEPQWQPTQTHKEPWEDNF